MYTETYCGQYMYKTVIIFLNADPSLKSCHFSKLSTLCRVSSKQTNKSFRFEPKQTETQSVSVLFWFVSRNQQLFFSVCFGVSDPFRNNRNKQICFETNRKKTKKYKSNRKISLSNCTEKIALKTTVLSH
jgi:hypothetical protein